MIRYSSFNDAALLYDTLADVSTPQGRGWETMGAVVRRRPPWFIVFLLSVLIDQEPGGIQVY
jgi:hypothetical protein